MQTAPGEPARRPAPDVSPRTLGAFLLPRHHLIALLVAAFLALGLAAAVDHGRLLLVWDDPVQGWVEGARTAGLDVFFRATSKLGASYVVVPLGLGAALVTRRRSLTVATALVVATLGRPILEFLMKEAVDRARPDFERLVSGNGPSFPSGHVLASIALWGLLPMVVSLYSGRRGVWRASAAVSAVVILLVAASRVYLGVHWISDVVGGLILGSLFLVAVEVRLRSAPAADRAPTTRGSGPRQCGDPVQPGQLARVADGVDARDAPVLDGEAHRGVELTADVEADGG